MQEKFAVTSDKVHGVMLTCNANRPKLEIAPCFLNFWLKFFIWLKARFILKSFIGSISPRRK